MFDLIRFFYQLTLLKRRPQELPDSLFLLQVLLAIDLTLNLLLSLQAFEGPVDALMAILLELVLGAALLFAGLHSVGHSARWRQTFCALLGVGIVGALVSMGYRLIAALLGLPLVAGVLDLVVFFWLILAMGHVVRHAFEIPLPFGILIIFAYTLFVLGLVAQWFAPEMAAAQP